ncbi:hypothetical protein AB8A21_26085, partial [Streptomyces sp. BF23-18]
MREPREVHDELRARLREAAGAHEELRARLREAAGAHEPDRARVLARVERARRPRASAHRTLPPQHRR